MITVTGQLNEQWLFGTVDFDRNGMFPANYVDRIPAGLPQVELPSEEPAGAFVSVRDNFLYLACATHILH